MKNKAARMSETNNKNREIRIRQRLFKVSQMSVDEALVSLNSSHQGISENEVKIRSRHYKKAEICVKIRKNLLAHLWHCYANPFSLLLSTLALISYLTHDQQGGTIILLMVLLSTFLRFVQETRSNQAAQAISSLVSNTISVLRTPCKKKGPHKNSSCAEKVIPTSQLVPGDVICLSAGVMIPADVRILTCKDLFVAQSSLTGESLPVEKTSELSEREMKSQDLLERKNLAFMGTDVISGSATALVISTGAYTFFGKMAHQVLHEKPIASDFQKGIKKVSYLLIQFMLAMVPVVLLLNGFTKGDWLQASLFALSVAVGMTPEMLPMIVTATLAKGSLFLSKKKVIVKNLESIQSFGAMNILCTDKTGTLTQDKIILERYLDLSQREMSYVLELGYLNSYYQTGLKNLLDVAILDRENEIQELLDLQNDYQKVDEVPFDFVRKRMSVIVCEKGQKNLLICKGATSEILKVSTHIIDQEGVLELNETQQKRAKQLLDGLSRQGMRIVAVAYKEFSVSQTTFSVEDENSLTIAGFIAFLDPPKESTASALRALHASGVDVKILTGDNELVTKTVCHQVNLLVTGVLLGAEIDEMTDTELQEWVDKTTVFARLTPFNKQRVVKALQDKGHVVGFMGDGINDAPALKSADIGISVDSAVDIAKESADIILLEKSLMVLEDGILEGRKTFINMMKYIRMTASSNFGNVLSVMVASLFLPFLPMLPIQLLTQNLLYDTSQTAIPFDRVDQEDIVRPQTWNPKSLARFMLFFGPLSSLFDIATYIILWYVFKANSPAYASLFHTGWFCEGLLSQTLIVHMIRTRRVPFFGSMPALPLLVMTMAIMLIGLILPQSLLAPYFSLVPLPTTYYFWLIGILLSYVLVTQLMKSLYIKVFGWR